MFGELEDRDAMIMKMKRKIAQNRQNEMLKSEPKLQMPSDNLDDIENKAVLQLKERFN